MRGVRTRQKRREDDLILSSTLRRAMEDHTPSLLITTPGNQTAVSSALSLRRRERVGPPTRTSLVVNIVGTSKMASCTGFVFVTILSFCTLMKVECYTAENVSEVARFRIGLLSSNDSYKSSIRRVIGMSTEDGKSVFPVFSGLNMETVSLSTGQDTLTTMSTMCNQLLSMIITTAWNPEFQRQAAIASSIGIPSMHLNIEPCGDTSQQRVKGCLKSISPPVPVERWLKCPDVYGLFYASLGVILFGIQDSTILALQPSLNRDEGRYRLQTTFDPLLTSHHVGKITFPQHLGQIAEED
ncbi:hypothetical protein Bbelb_132430 [Branchiostoma belcheri]|nr:hypothetical protein Bbelb_132430 [Branchiostoma belcheri]